MAQVYARVRDGRIQWRCEASETPWCRTLPGVRYDTKDEAWSIPATPMNARTLVQHFQRDLGDEVRPLVDGVAPGTTQTDPPPWAHQREAFAFAHRSEAALLYMGLGTGKSRVAIDLIQNGPPGLYLLVCPLAVMESVWKDQFDRYLADGGRTQVFICSRDMSVERKAQALRALVETARIRKEQRYVFVVNYDSVWRRPLHDELLSHRYAAIIADEVHRIKAAGSKVSKFFQALGRRGDRRYGLSGTPMANSWLDIYGIYRFLAPDIFGTSWVRFRNKYAITGGEREILVFGYRNEDDLNKRFYSIAYYAGRENLDLPPETDTIRTARLGQEAQRIYDDLRDEMVAQVGTGTLTAANGLVRLLRLQQLTGGFATINGDVVEVDDVKARLLGETLEDIATDDRVVVFTKFVQDVETVRKVARAHLRPCFQLTGGENQLAEWEQTPGAVLAANIQAGSEGVSMVAARYCVYYSVGYSLSQYLQSRGRVRRPGQRDPVTYIHLVCERTVDELVYKALREKKDIIQTILHSLDSPASERGSSLPSVCLYRGVVVRMV